MSEYARRQLDGIDLHRRRSVIVGTTESGEVLESVRILDDVESLGRVIGRAGEDPEVVLEATYGWYWAVDSLRKAGATPSHRLLKLVRCRRRRGRGRLRGL